MSFDIAALLSSVQEANAKELEAKKAFFAQPGYIWRVCINRNAPSNPRTGHLGQVNGVRAVNGAVELGEAFNQPFKAWIFDASGVVSKYQTGLQFEYYITEEAFNSDEAHPITEADTITSRNNVTGKLYETVDGTEVILAQGEPVPEDYTAITEFIFKAYLNEGLVPSTDKVWDPQASNVFKGMDNTAIAARLQKNSERFKKNQAAGLTGWRNANSVSSLTAPSTGTGTGKRSAKSV